MPLSYPFLSVISSSEVILTVIVHPRSHRKIAVIHSDSFHVYLVEPPEHGKANKALLKFLSKTFHLPSSSFSIVSGATSKVKRISITHPDVLDVVSSVLQQLYESQS